MRSRHLATGFDMRGRKLIPVDQHKMAGGQCSGQSPQAHRYAAILNILVHGLLLAPYARIHAYSIGK